MINKAPGKLFLLNDGRTIWADESGYKDNGDHYEIRADRAWYVMCKVKQSDVKMDQERVDLDCTATRVSESVTGILNMKIFKSGLLSVDTISDKSPYYLTVLRVKSGLIIPGVNQEIVKDPTG